MQNTEVRIDKFLWCVRLFKTRALASDACKTKKILVNKSQVKSAKTIKINDKIQIIQNPMIRSFIVKDFPKSRVSAKLVENYITETTPEEEFLKLKLSRENIFRREKGSGRPTKKERRILDDFTK